MRCDPGMPRPWIAVPSTFRICSAVYRPISSDSYISSLLGAGRVAPPPSGAFSAAATA